MVVHDQAEVLVVDDATVRLLVGFFGMVAWEEDDLRSAGSVDLLVASQEKGTARLQT